MQPSGEEMNARLPCVWTEYIVGRVLVIAAVLMSFAAPGAAQDPAFAAAPAAAQPTVAAINPWNDRPDCASMFLKSDWQLSPKQRACAWLYDGVLSTNAVLGSLWSARFSQDVDLTSEQGDPFVTRFGRKFGQSAIKSTAIYLGALISREDTRTKPPYLIMRPAPPHRGFFRRFGSAIAGNVVGSRCIRKCTSKEDIRPRFVFSKLAGSFASGFAGEMLTSDRPDSLNHALRGSASAYAATFGNAVFSEFRPELSAFAGRLFRTLGGSR
jgi:hypothetical protein